ncbi:hypothetical protein GIY62_06530 [Burkholderia plantarii]|nr:hypothetical protein GIY62_06530 [Burkholderia plantarii]
MRARDSEPTRIRLPIEQPPQHIPPKEITSKGKPKLIPLQVWAEQTFGEHAPHANTLRRWVRNGKILPVAIKVGRSYFVRPEAEYFDPFEQKIRRMIGGR